MWQHFAMKRGAVVIALLVVASILGPGVDAVGAAAGQGVGPPEAGNWKAVSAGAEHTCGLRGDGTLWCWGDDAFGQLGNGGGNADAGVPVQVAGGRTDWVAVTAGGYFTCARRASGRLYCWGADTFGAIGNGAPNTDVGSPVEVAGGRTDWRQVSAGWYHVCARRSTGRLFCWGHDGTAALGNGPGSGNSSSPVEVAGARTDWSTVSAGFSSTCALRTSRRLFCFGSDQYGQLGRGAGFQVGQTPAEVAGARTDWAAVVVGVDHACARRTTGNLFCWGRNTVGEIGNGATGANVESPAQVTGNRTDWRQFALADRTTCARRSDGHLFCWGFDNTGQLGNGEPKSDSVVPVEVSGGASDWRAVDGGLLHVCARRGADQLFCWGFDSEGQLGDGGADSSRSSPVQVA